MNSIVHVEHGDCLKVIPRLVAEGILCDAVVTDPPYHMTATLARFGKININDDTATSTRLRKKADAAARLAHGFMNQQWDGGDIAFDPETWRIIGTALRPGGFLLAFGAPRTHHRLTCAIEDAGFVIQDCLLWLFGTGFPKRRDAFKPAYEPVICAYKPSGKRTLQVDECRIAGVNPSPERRASAARNGTAPGKPGTYGHTITNRITPEVYCAEHPGELLGRWPANVMHDGSDEVLNAFPQDEGGNASRFFYCAKASKDDRFGSRHPTVKPMSLMRWLVKLVTPPDGLVLDPFAGSGPTGTAALAEDRNAILIEREAQYVVDIRERIAAYYGDTLGEQQTVRKKVTLMGVEIDV